ncbi:MAG: hypothetical protein J5U19_07295 [Candidatus Methanoperedens sp.]|nr:hypothetical protein [Candidatus Methanoperedens sp.]
MDEDNIIQLIDSLVPLFNPIVEAIEDENNAKSLFQKLGYLPPSEVLIFKDLKPSIESLLDFINEVDESLDSNTEIDYFVLFKDIVVLIQNIIQSINAINSAIQRDFSGSSFLTDTDILQSFPRKLLDYLIIQMLEKKYSVVHSILISMGLIEESFITEVPTPFHTQYLKKTINWDKIPVFISHPEEIFQKAYDWNAASFQYEKFMKNILKLGHSLNFHSEITNPSPLALKAFHEGINVVNEENALSLKILKFPFFSSVTNAIGIQIYPLFNQTNTKIDGFGIGIYLDPKLGLEFNITENLKLKNIYNGTEQLGLGLLIRTNEPIKMINHIFASNFTANIPQNIQFSTEFIYSKEDNKILIFEISGGSRLYLRNWIFRLGVLIPSDKEKEIFIETEFNDVELSIGTGEGDGFLNKLLPSKPMKLNFNITLGYSNKAGLYFKGSGGLEIMLPTHIQLGPIEIQSALISIKPDSGKIPIQLGATVKGNLGPLTVVIGNVGLKAEFTFPPSDGNLGPIQLGVGFKPPTGIGLSLDTSAVKAGGFLSIKPDEYIGALELEIKAIKLAIKAIAIINTKLPGDEPGFSLLVIITAEFSPITLVFGFTLNGLGGLFGHKRKFNRDELRLGLKTKALDSILFPKNVIANITKIVGDLKNVFPIGNNFLIGPMVKIGWGASLVTAEIGIIIQIPDLVIAILGVIRLQLPDPKDAVLKLQINFLGIIDFEKKMLSLDSSLTDSRILTMTLTGEFAVRLGWGFPPVFIFSSGGFHPDFKEAPVELQHMERLGLQIINEAEMKLGVDTYFALTTNTVQIGAHARFWAKSGSYTAQAEVGFDALIQFKPFFFSIAIFLTGRVTGPMVDVVIEVKGNLSGPNPWHTWGFAHAKVLFFEITIPFNKTFGDPIEELSAGIENVLKLLIEEIPKNTNWKTTTVINGISKVSLREITPDPDNMIVHPNTVLSFNQRVVPLEVAIQNFGNKGVDEPKKFSITAQATVSDTKLYDSFAPGNFFEIGKDQKLSRPSFEQMKSGIEFTIGSSSAAVIAILKDIDYEVIYIRNKKIAEKKEISLLKPYQVVLLASGGAAARSKLSVENTRVSYQAPPKITINRPRYIVAKKADLSEVVTEEFGNQVEAYNKRLEFDENETLILSTQEI